MARAFLRRLLAIALIFMISAGGGGLPVLDGLIYHSRGATPQDWQTHYEASSGCHADGCAIRSTAQQARFTAVIESRGLVVLAPESWMPERVHPAPFSNSPFGQPLSRAPPVAA